MAMISELTSASSPRCCPAYAHGVRALGRARARSAPLRSRRSSHGIRWSSAAPSRESIGVHSPARACASEAVAGQA